MATFNAYAGRFVGNEFILPRRPLKQQKEEPRFESEPVVETPQLVPAHYSAPITKARSIRINRRLGLLIFAMVFSVSLVSLSIATLAKNNPVAAVSNLTSKIQQRIQTNLTYPVNFIQPPFSVVVASKNLAADINNIATQPIEIKLSFATLNPSTADVTKWISISKGPKAGSTLLAINTTLVNSYLNSLAKSYSRAPVNQVVMHNVDGSTTIQTIGINGINFGGISQTTSSLSTQLLSAKGVTIALSGTAIPFSVINVNQP